ncbi:hypothetical protein RHSP_64010 [Rhizobium freirei PRF 81]|uniref:Uncharacterized protein n=1 Tax=Rhizobium freirei PRF 81 TaxID=363754 RepID=N6U1Q5_9HYPH|nr:hypothetical protein RHSP_64010 [Rhizobium freirei PRF 81]
MIEGCQHLMIVFEQRPKLARFLRCDELSANALNGSNAHIALVLVQAVARIGDPQLPAFVPTDMLPGFRLQALIYLDRLGDHSADVDAAGVRRDEACRMPGRTRGELGTLQQRDICPATFGESIEDGGADTTTTDDNGASMSLH